LHGRWRRFDAELDAPRDDLPDPTDIGPCPAGGVGFVTAALAWTAYRQGDLDGDPPINVELEDFDSSSHRALQSPLGSLMHDRTGSVADHRNLTEEK
jgi:hypothetical protein